MTVSCRLMLTTEIVSPLHLGAAGGGAGGFGVAVVS
jgi:hypothetical protein